MLFWYIYSCVLNPLIFKTNQCFPCMFHRPLMMIITAKMINFLCNFPPLWYQVLECVYAKVSIKPDTMLLLSHFCFSKYLRSVGCGYVRSDASNEWFFGGPDNKWCDKVSDIYLIILGSTLDFPKKLEIIEKYIKW